MATKKTPAAASPADRIAELLAERDHLLELKELTEQAPRSQAEAEADVPRVLEMLVSRCEPAVQWLAQGPAGYADLARQLSQQDEGYAQIPAASILAWCMPDVLADALKRDLAAAYSELPKAMTSAAKATEMARLQTAIAAVEADLASTWWQAIDAGMTLDIPPISGAALVGLPA